MQRNFFTWRFIFALALIPLCAFAQVNPREYQVKAAFLYNFVKFIEWPSTSSAGGEKNINICIIGNNPFGDIAAQMFARASTASLKLTLVEKHSWSGSATGCHMAFISRSESAHVDDIIAVLKSKPVLTVSDIDDFANRGGMIGFIDDDSKVKLVVNAGAVSASGLRVDAQLLEIAAQVIRN